jgi:hypothetical protein
MASADRDSALRVEQQSAVLQQCSGIIAAVRGGERRELQRQVPRRDPGPALRVSHVRVRLDHVGVHHEVRSDDLEPANRGRQP